ncbi:Mdm33 family-domain-containing protein [Jackrogersella minutella]|nr:Mdm33 family-domain-containing protein [Jackrogersella minutella]
MSTSRALKPIFGPSCRLLFDQLAPQSTRKFVCSSSRPIAPVCSSCRHSFILTLTRHRLRFYSSSSASPPPKPPVDEPGNGKDDDKNPSEQFDPASAYSSAPFPFPEHLQPNPEPRPEPRPEPAPQEPAPQKPPPEQPPPPSEKPPPPGNDLPENPDLPSAQNSRRSALNRRLSAFMDGAQTTLFAASQRINDLTGYSGIEVLKQQISQLEGSLASAQTALHGARVAYKSAVSSRSSTQREVTTLLARQKTWTPADFERFTALYRQDYELEALVASRAAELEDAERDAERLGRELSAGILSRYHEEQIWSDKIRRMSTWGTWGLMGVNILLFLVLQFGAEPWRRRRLVKGFEAKVQEALEEERRLERAFRKQENEIEGERRRAEGLAAATAAAAAGAPVVVDEASEKPAKANLASEPADGVRLEEPKVSWRTTWREAFTNADYWKSIYAQLSSDRKVAVRMRDVSLLVLESAAAGAAVVGTVAAVIFIRRA